MSAHKQQQWMHMEHNHAQVQPRVVIMASHRLSTGASRELAVKSVGVVAEQDQPLPWSPYILHKHVLATRL
jgi:hypothetical protein